MNSNIFFNCGNNNKNMTDETKVLPTNMLTAGGLLENKGLKHTAWDEYEKSAKTLPRTGMKQFEPSNSWLENVQIEKGIITHKNLIAIERVDRISQLASAEWLPAQKKAKVKKYSGQDWSCFGLEIGGSLYLIPEEALFLLEANSLELTWNSVPLSIQQAYDLLIDNVECSLDEYRVYSQLVRHGYRIQRFIYNSEKRASIDDNGGIKRKVIVDPENGLWMSDTQHQSKDCKDTKNSDTEMCQNVTEYTDIPNIVYEAVDNLLCEVENIEAQSTKCTTVENNVANQEKLNPISQIINTRDDKKKRKLEIISEETLLSTIKIIKHHQNDSNNGSNATMNWRASRIQRNVKLLPKRTDIAQSSTDNLDPATKNSEYCSSKDKSSSPCRKNVQTTKFKHEVIELSDDEIQEIPKPMSRVNLLNLIPNIALQPSITIKISRGYIPHSIKPYKTSYHYESAKLRNLQQTDKRLRSGKNLEYSSCNTNQISCQYNRNPASDYSRKNMNIIPLNQNLAANINTVFIQNFFSMHHGQHVNFHASYAYNNRMLDAYSQNSYWLDRNTMFENRFVTPDNHSTGIHQNSFSVVQMNNVSTPNISNNMLGNFCSRNQLYNNIHQNIIPLRKLYHNRIVENMSIQHSVPKHILLPEPRQRYRARNHYRNINMPKHKDEAYQSTFKVLAGASSWLELKAKWREEKTITIDDEDIEKDEVEECNEVQVVRQLRSPLVGSKSGNSLEEVFSKLKIIKSAPEKIVRRKKSKHKISYNVYSNTQSYRKTNPGLPFYRVIVIRHDDPFIQPIELQRLLQDAHNSPIVLAYVSMSISYIQPGFISVPNLT